LILAGKAWAAISLDDAFIVFSVEFVVMRSTLEGAIAPYFSSCKPEVFL
jgi:hypothetical protein